MFESTLPADTPDLMRVSVFQRYLDDGREGAADAGSSRMSALNPSLMQDLQRFEEASTGLGMEVLEVLAAAVRHGRALLMHLEHESRVLPLTVFPAEHLVHCPIGMDKLLASRLTDLHVLHVEPAQLRPLGHSELVRVGDPLLYNPLGPLLWELALRGPREELLPEIAGTAAYRIAPGVNLSGLDLSGSLGAAVTRLKRETSNLRELAQWPGFDMARAQRMLNGLYLQAGLMVSRTHPAATNDGWFAAGVR
jgi:hypothetical protein